MSTPLDDPDRRISRLESLGWSRDVAALPELLTALQDSDPPVRRVAVSALGQVGDPSVVPSLLAVLVDPDPGVRQAVATALADLADPRAMSGLLRILHDPDPAVRCAAARALGRLGDPAALPGLLAAAQDPHPYVRQAVERALSLLRQTHSQMEMSPHWMAGPPSAEPALTSRLPSARRRRHPRRRALGWVLGGLIALVAVLAGTGLWMWNRPLGPRLSDRTVAPAGVILATPLPSPIPAAPPRCGGPPVLFVLVAGLDTPLGGYETGAADVIRVARIDFVTPSATVLAIPRDLWVPIPGMDVHGIPANRIKAAFAYGVHYQVPGGGPGLLVDTLAYNFGVVVDRYAVANFNAFAAGIDAVGGIDLYVPEPVGSPDSSDPYFAMGWHHMDGATALQYARLRPGNSSDLYRIDRQTALMLALRDRVFSSEVLPSLPALIRSMQESVLTDLSPAEINMLVCIGRAIDSDHIRTLTIDPTLMTSIIDEYGYERLQPDFEGIRRFVQTFNAGEVH